MEITVNGLGGLQRMLHRVQRLSDLDRKVKEVAERLCQIGEPIIRQVHGHHADDIHTEPTKNGYKIVASGQDVMFIEFGAGEDAGSENANYDAVPECARPGTWSEAHQGEYWRTGGPGEGFWHFGGQVFRTVPPTPAFYYAYEYMAQNLPRIAREVFGNG